MDQTTARAGRTASTAMRAGPGAWAVAGLLAALSAQVPVRAVESPVRYRVTLDMTWSEATHPDEFPSSPHFSPPVGGTHRGDVAFWGEGEQASAGVKDVAEIGDHRPLAAEIDAAGAGASPSFAFPVVWSSPGAVSGEFTTLRGWPRLTLVTMIAPSPDWFSGTEALPLFDHGRFRDDFSVPVYAYDAGTDSGPSYQSPNQPMVPPGPVRRIHDGPLSVGGASPPVGRFAFEILDVAGASPYGDLDHDGLTNLREAEIGSDPFESDTDADSLADPFDNCPATPNTDQSDADGDAAGDACDNCPARFNPGQDDIDDDGQGDRCDPDDGLLFFADVTRTALAWQEDAGLYEGFSLYRGDLDRLRAGGAYTQDPATVPAAARFCDLTLPNQADAYEPAGGAGVFYLVGGIDAAGSHSLGQDSAYRERPNTLPCP